jgi:hypothetical protein
MNGWTIFYWGWWISWGPFVGAFLARISKGRKLGTFILATLIIPSLWSFAFVGVFGAAQIRISNQAISATQYCVSQLPENPNITLKKDCDIWGTCEGCTFTYGSTADKKLFGWMQQDEEGKDKWVEVPDTVTRLYMLGTEDVLFEQLQTYGGEGWSTFTSVVTLICIILYFVTSSDSASFVVDMLAANGRAEPPITQKVFWALTEGFAAAICILVGGDDPSNVLKALQAVPIVLGLPYTFHLFYCCQSLIIICKEESGELSKERKNFTNFLLFNGEPMSFLSFLLPCIPAGLVAHRTLGGSKAAYLLAFGFLWVFFLVLCFLTLADVAFSSMAVSAYFVFGMTVGFLRGAVRNKVGITGDMISDMVCSTFWLPFALGQMHGEDLDAVPPQEAAKAQVIGNPESKQVDI